MIRAGHTWTNKPPPGTPIDPGHPHARGLAAEFLPSNAGNFVDRLGVTYTWTGTNAGTEGGRTGLAARTGATGAYATATTIRRAIPSTSVTIAFVARSNSDAGAIWDDAADSNNEILFRYGGTIYWDWGNTTSGSRLLWTPPAGYFNTYHALAFRAGTGGMSIWSDGVQQASYSPAVNTFLAVPITSFRVGTNLFNGLNEDASIEGLWIWGRQLSDAAIAAWSAQPYAMYAAPTPRRFVYAAPAGAAVTRFAFDDILPLCFEG